MLDLYKFVGSMDCLTARNLNYFTLALLKLTIAITLSLFQLVVLQMVTAILRAVVSSPNYQSMRRVHVWLAFEGYLLATFEAV